MAVSAALLVDAVLPKKPIHKWAGKAVAEREGNTENWVDK